MSCVCVIHHGLDSRGGPRRDRSIRPVNGARLHGASVVARAHEGAMKASWPAGRGGGCFKSENVYWCPSKAAFLDCYLFRPANVDAWRRRRLVQPGCWKAFSSAPNHPAPSFDGAVSEERARRWCGAGMSNDRITGKRTTASFSVPLHSHVMKSTVWYVESGRGGRRGPEDIIRDAWI